MVTQYSRSDVGFKLPSLHDAVGPPRDRRPSSREPLSKRTADFGRYQSEWRGCIVAAKVWDAFQEELTKEQIASPPVGTVRSPESEGSIEQTGALMPEGVSVIYQGVLEPAQGFKTHR